MGDAPKLAVSVPSRASFESLFTGGFSPGPMTLVSSFFADSDNCSFSQLLAGAMASPIVKPATNIFSPDIITSSSAAAATTTTTSSKDDATEREKVVSGYKQNRPVGLVLAQSPLFMVPPGLTPSGLLNSPGFLSPLQSPFGMSHQQALAHVTAQAAFSQSYMKLQAEFQSPSEAASVEALEDQSCPVPNESLQQQVHSVPQEPVLKIESPEISQSDRKLASSVDKLENDGYNWRKYGQKQVKASEHPRSYYKCTNLNCPVKKKVERSVDGHITEITYKGQHNHDPPQPSRRTKDGSGLTGVSSSRTKAMHGSQGQNDISTYTPADLASREAHVSVQMSSEQLPVTSEDGRLQDNAIIVKEDDKDDQPNAKRICSEVGVSAPASSHKTVTEPRIIVQTRSEVDLLDDGYKWRKYGQKVVKGNPYPRSYYRCTYVGCNVRKHVERASADPKAVITTYEGKHNHSIPTAKNNCNSTAKSNTGQLKSQKMITGKHSRHTEMDFEMKDQIPVLPQLKEGEIAA